MSKVLKDKIELFPRKCEQCNKGLNKGFYDAGTVLCSLDCLLIHNQKVNKTYSLLSWKKDCDDLPNDCYYTEWEELEDDENFTIDGEVISINKLN